MASLMQLARIAFSVSACGEITVVCRAFVTRSSETCSGFCAGEAVAEESSHPFQALLHPCFQRKAPCHRAWLEELLLLMGAREKQMYASEVSRTEGGRQIFFDQG